MNLMGFLLIAAGAFSLAGGIYNWDWYMNTSRSRFIVNFLGRNGARYFYSILGSGIIIVGVLVVLKVVE